jgi:RNA polymerase sigma factor (sigma-70 family)
VVEIEELFSSHYREIYLYIYSLSGSPETADDIAAETFLKAAVAIDSFRGQCGIRTWLYQIAKNTYISHQRKTNRYILTDEVGQKITVESAESTVLANETRLAAEHALLSLSQPYQEVFSLRLFGELSFQQIADLYGKTANWACVTYHRARSRMRDEMRDMVWK